VTPDAVMERLRAICMALPETAEVEAWGHPTFRVGVGKKQKIFCACGVDGDAASLGWKCEPEVQHALVASDPRFTIAAYVGKHGWVSFRASGKIDWRFVTEAVKESYRLVAGKEEGEAKASKPAKSAKPARRARPAKPAQHAKPAQRAKPAKNAQRAKPAKPAKKA
jgi:predicted DNA-binding protein (MmcQ/YjbR family)